VVQVRKDNTSIYSNERLKAIYREIGIILTESSSGRLTCLCPFPDHKDSAPSFVVYPDGGYHCFGCDQHGELVDILGLSGIDPTYNLSKIDLTLTADTVYPFLRHMRKEMEDRLRTVLKSVEVETAIRVYDLFDRFLVECRYFEWQSRLEAAVVYKKALKKLIQRAGGAYARAGAIEARIRDGRNRIDA
jgi:hypothetical protein